MSLRPTLIAVAATLLSSITAFAEPLVYDGFGSTDSPYFRGHEPASPIGLGTAPPWALPSGNWSQPDIWNGQLQFNFGYFKFFPAATDQTLTNVPFRVELDFLSSPSGGSLLPSASGLLVSGVLNGTVHGAHNSDFSDSYPTVTAQVTSVTTTHPLSINPANANVWAELPFPLSAVHVELAPFAMNQDRTSIPISVDISALVPEPSTAILFLGTIAAIVLRRRLRASDRSQADRERPSAFRP